MLATVTTVPLTKLEAVVLLRMLRKQSAALTKDMVELEERRIRGGFDGTLDDAYRHLDTERTILGDVIRRMWDLVA
jgi:hypothetical protein